MAIEPLGSVMSYQAQTVKPAAPKVAVDKSAAEFTEGAVRNNSGVIDKTTPVVTQVTEGGEQNGNPQNNNQAQNEQIRKAVEQLNKKMNNSEAVYGIHAAGRRLHLPACHDGQLEDAPALLRPRHTRLQRLLRLL